MRRLLGVGVLLVVAMGAGCRKKETPPPVAAASAEEKHDHEIGISNLRVSALPSEEYELTVDVHDPKGDLAPDQQAVAKYQIVCPGGSAHGVLSEPTQLVSKDGRLTARHRIATRQVKKGTEPCLVRLAVGHRYDFLSNEVEAALPR